MDVIIAFMSGHSKWSTIKRQKAANDNARGKVFSKHSKAIQVAVKTGGGDSIESNYKLRVAVEAAKADNMPKDTIERAISKASSSAENIEEISYEGFGPGGVQVFIEAATDNRNRTSQEVKSILEKSGGSMGGPGSVAFNFEQKGELRLKKSKDFDEMTLEIIDFGVEDVEENGESLLAYTSATDLFDVKNKLEDKGYEVLESRLVRLPKTTVDVKENSGAAALMKMMGNFDDNEDVQNVYLNAEISDELLNSAS